MTNKLFLVECPVLGFFFQIAGTNTTPLSGFSFYNPTLKRCVSLFYRIYCLCFYCSLSVVFSVQNCNSISKREAVRADPAQGLLSYGPIKIEMPSRPHSSKLLFLQQGFNAFEHFCRHTCRQPPRCDSCGIYVALVFGRW